MSRLSVVLAAFAFALLVVAAPNSAVPLSKRGSPLVTLDYGTFQGFGSAFSTESFLGVPFAQPPYVPKDLARRSSFVTRLEI